MATAPIEELTSQDFVDGLDSMALDEVRRRRGLCQSAEEVLSFRRRLVQGRLDIVQAELFRRSGNVTEAGNIVDSLPDILAEHGDRHLGPGRLTSLDTTSVELGDDFDNFEQALEEVVPSAQLSDFSAVDDTDIRSKADRLDQMERSISSDRHRLHKHIDIFQEEIVKRYKTGQASVEGLLDS